MPVPKGITMASIQARKRADGDVSYRVQFRVDGQMRSKSFATSKGAQQFSDQVDRVGARAALAVWQTRQNRNMSVPILRDWIDTYLDEASGYLTGIQPGTRDDYRGIADRSIIPILGDISLDAVTKADVGRWIAWQESQKSRRRGATTTTSPKTVRNYHAFLSSVFTAAVEAKLRTDNPARGVRISRGQKHEAVFLSRNEFATLLHFVPAHYKPLVMFLVGSGSRWSEATALERRDINVDTEPATARISKAWKKNNVIGPPKSDKGRRTVSLWPEIVGELDLSGNGSGFLFQGVQNASRVWYGPFKTRVWDRAVAAANDAERCAEAGLAPIGKRPTPHDLRHTHASWLIAAGAPLPFVQARLGHEKITATVDTYWHLLPDAHVQMAAIMQETMSHVLPAIES
jgi:integrase